MSHLMRHSRNFLNEEAEQALDYIRCLFCFSACLIFRRTMPLVGPARTGVPARDEALLAADAHWHSYRRPSQAAVDVLLAAWLSTLRPLLALHSVRVAHPSPAPTPRGASRRAW